MSAATDGRGVSAEPPSDIYTPRTMPYMLVSLDVSQPPMSVLQLA